jgi:hypothetical protein
MPAAGKEENGYNSQNSPVTSVLSKGNLSAMLKFSLHFEKEIA